MITANVKGKLWVWWSWLLDWGPNLVLAVVAALVIQSEFPRTLPGEELRDFGSFVASGRAARDGLNPYGIYPPLTYHVKAPGLHIWNQNLNPPISGLLFQLFSLAEPRVMFRIWYVITMALYAAVIFLLVRRYREAPRLVFVLWACALPGFWDTLQLGQIYIPLVLATVGAWLLLERGRTDWAGVLIGIVVAIKPNFGVWPALLFLSGHFRPAVISGTVAVLISAVPAVVLGPLVYKQWFELLASDAARAVFLTNVSLNGLAARAGLPVLGIVLAAVSLAGCALWAWWRKRDVLDLSAIALLFALLASPVAWVHYTLFLLPVICAKWRVRGMVWVAALMMVTIPFIIGQLGEALDVRLTLGSVYTWAVLILLVVLVTDQLRRTGPRSTNDDLLAEPTFLRAASGSAATIKNLLSWRTWSSVWVLDLLFALLGLWVISAEFSRVLPRGELFDFGSLLGSAQAARDGLNPYGIYPPFTFHVIAPGFDSWNQNLNPPISVLLVQVFGLGEPHLMFRIWFAFNIVLYAFAIGLLLLRYKETPRVVFAIWACSLAGFFETLALGQIHMPLVLATVAAWLLLERGVKWWAGVLIGFVVAVKPNFVVWPVLLLLAGYTRPAAVSLVTAAVLSAIPAAVLGLQVYTQWFGVLGRPFVNAWFLTNVSLTGSAARAGLPMVGIALAAGLLCASGLWAWMRRGFISIIDVSAVALVVALLVAPAAWVHFTIFLLPAICAKWRLPGMRLVAAGLMVPIPFIIRQLGRDTDIQLTLGSIYGWAVVFLFGVLAADELRKAGLLRSRLEVGHATATSS